MAFNPEPSAAHWQTLLSLALTGKTERCATEPTTLDDGTIYDTVMRSLSPLQLSAGSILDPRIVPPYLEVELDNADDVIRTTSDTYEFGGKAATLQLGQENAAASFETVFSGTVRFPGSISYWDDRVLRIELEDARTKDAKVLPINRFDPATYANMETKSYYLSVPLLYGDWRTTAGGGEVVPAYQIDSTEGTGGRFKVCDHAIPAIEAVYLNGVSKAFTAATGDLDIGEFVLDVAYAPATDTCTVNCQGATNDGLRTGTRLDTLPAIYNDILQTHLSVSAVNIDATAIATWEAALNTTDYGRRWIGTEVNSDDLLRDLLVEGWADPVVSGGKYTPVYRQVLTTGAEPNFAGSEIRSRPDGQKAFSIRKDPDRTYANEVVGDYRYDPIAGSYLVTYAKQRVDAILAIGTTKRRRLQFNWLYLAGGAERRVNREVFVFSNELEILDVTFDPNGMLLEPTDQFRLLYSKYEISSGLGTPFQVRSISKDFSSMTARVSAWNMNNTAPGQWTSASANAWSAATAWEKQTQGFWCDASGRASPGDPTSSRSVFW